MSRALALLNLPSTEKACRLFLLATLLVGGWGGCIDGLLWPGAGGTDRNVGLSPADFPAKRIQGEPNDTFAEPLDVIFDSQGHGHLAGSIASLDDVDVYRLGALVAGDRIIADVGTSASRLDAAVVIFDDTESVCFENDDRNYDLSQYDPFLNEVVRHDSSEYFLAVAAAPLGAFGTSMGSYEILLTLVHGNDVPAPKPQVVVLDFDGGTVNIPDYGTYSLTMFDAADIGSQYAGQTAELRQLIAARIRECYDGLALDVVIVPGNPLPAGDYSSIYFGGNSSDAFGVAQDIDPYNQDHSDNAVIFTELFTGELFGRPLTLSELGTAIGNVAAHELGHLLGLNHVADIMDLMDTTGGANTLLLDQQFLDSSPLDDSVFPIGNQNELLWLEETLGLY